MPRGRAEDGVTLVELLVTISVGVVVFLGLYTFIDVASSNSDRVTSRIEANKIARPAMANIMDRLHTACIAPGMAPIQAGSTGTSMTFINSTGSEVSPTPVKRTISWSSTQRTLTEQIFARTGGTAPSWTFSTTPSSTRILASPVVQSVSGSTTTPIFRYYAYGTNGQISTTPLPVPLSSTNAARTVQVTVTITVPPRGTPDPEGNLTLSDSALFRFNPAAESSTIQNVPCA